MSQKNNTPIDHLGSNWMLSPSVMAQRVSEGRWIPYDYLTRLSNFITPKLGKGNARIIVSMPPRHGKSEFISHWIPVWWLENFKTNIILTSYEATYASRWGGRIRDTIANTDLLNTKLRKDSSGRIEFMTEDGAEVKTAGVGGPITGRGGHLLLIDDPVKNWQEAMNENRRELIIDWFNSTLYTRCEPGGNIVLLMTRWHENDLAGYLENEHQDNWDLFCLPALAEKNDPIGRELGEALCPDRYNRQTLKGIEKAVGPRIWSSLYQQHPSSAEGEILKREYWRFYREPPGKFDEIIQSWDLTFKDHKESDYVVGTVWGRVGANLYLLDLFRGQWSFVKTIEMILKATKKWPRAYTKLIENKANGPAVDSQLKSRVSGIRLVEPLGGKIARAVGSEPAIAAGNVHLPLAELQPWVDAFIEECAAFPKGKHDDMVDSATQAINFLVKKSNSALYKLATL